MRVMRVTILMLAVLMCFSYLLLNDRCVFSYGLPVLCEWRIFGELEPLFLAFPIAGGTSITTLFFANVFSNVFFIEGSKKTRRAASFYGHEIITDGLLWRTDESTLVVTEERTIDEELGVILLEHIGITKSGRWFSLSADVKRGQILKRELTPLADSVAKKRLESHREAYEQHFGSVEKA